MPRVVASVRAKFRAWKLSALPVGVWVMLISMASLVEPSVGAEVEVISRASPVVREAAATLKTVWVVAPEVIVDVSRLPVKVSAVLLSPKVVLPLTVRSPLAVKVPAEVIVPEPVVEILPVVEMVILDAKSPPAIVPSNISVVVTPPVLILTAPEETAKLPEEKEAIPLAAVVASSIVTVVPDPEELARVSTPVSPSSEATTPLAQDPKLGVVPPSKH